MVAVSPVTSRPRQRLPTAASNAPWPVGSGARSRMRFTPQRIKVRGGGGLTLGAKA